MVRSAQGWEENEGMRGVPGLGHSGTLRDIGQYRGSGQIGLGLRRGMAWLEIYGHRNLCAHLQSMLRGKGSRGSESLELSSFRDAAG